MRVAGSNPVFRSLYILSSARMVELVDTLDLKSNGHYVRTGSSPVPGTERETFERLFPVFCFKLSNILIFLYICLKPLLVLGVRYLSPSKINLSENIELSSCHIDVILIGCAFEIHL